MQCVILCAGFATRLYPLTIDRPKQLLPIADGPVADHILEGHRVHADPVATLIAGRPMLDHLLDRLAEAGLNRGVLVTNHRFISHFQEWAATGKHALSLQILDDGTETNETRLGSIGDLQFALDAANVREDFIVVNGDNLFTLSLVPVLETFRRIGNTIALYDVESFDVARLMGHATCDGSGRVFGFVEKPANPASTLASIGIYVYQAAVRDLVGLYLSEGRAGDRTGDFVAWLHTQVPIYAHTVPTNAGVWFDIGSLEQYEEANRTFAKMKTQALGTSARQTKGRV